MDPNLGAGDQARRISELDGIRGFAVGLILIQHFWPNVGSWRAALPVTELGWIGVDLFFVLSGFLITGILLDSLDRPDYFRRFYIRRAFRIFPLYYVFLILIFGFLAAWHGGLELTKLRTKWGSPVWFFVYLANFTSVAKGTFPLFGPLGPPWSLQIEEQFYLVFPTVVRFFRKGLGQLLVGTLIGSLAWRSYWLIYAPDNAMIQYLGTLSRLDALAAGALSALLIRRLEPDRLRASITYVMPFSMMLLVTFYAWAGNEPSNPVTRSVGYSVNALTFASLILWSVQHQNEPVSAIFRWKPAGWLGKISYGVYLLQLPVQSLMKLLTSSPLGTAQRLPAQSLVWLTATLAIAYLSWRYFERPLQDYGYRLTTEKPLPITENIHVGT